MDEINITVIGAGVVGLAVAAELSKEHDSIILLERHEAFGQETSSRNSEVIHSGIYYPQGSLKARLCVEGRELLYGLCAKNSVPHKKLGKLIVATDESEVPVIEGLLEKGRRNNVANLRLISGDEARRMEPRANAVAALHSPETGIIDSHSLMKHYYHEGQARGVLHAFNSEVVRVVKEGGGFTVEVRQEGYIFRTRAVVNCAGLGSERIAALAGIDTRASGYTLHPCKGSYFSYAKKSPVNMLIYPIPHEELTGLGVHATLDLGGRLRFGPDTEYVTELDYRVDEGKKADFYRGAAKIISGMEEEALMPDMAGIRPKLQGPGEKVRDFVIAEESGKGLPGLINLVGIESPGLTAAPAIARLVASMLKTF